MNSLNIWYLGEKEKDWDLDWTLNHLCVVVVYTEEWTSDHILNQDITTLKEGMLRNQMIDPNSPQRNLSWFPLGGFISKLR